MSEDIRPRSPCLEEIAEVLPTYWALLLSSMPPLGHEPIRAEVEFKGDPHLFAVEGTFEGGGGYSTYTLRFSRTDRCAERLEFLIELGFYHGRMEHVRHSDVVISRRNGWGYATTRHHGVADTSVEFLRSKSTEYSRALMKLVAGLTDNYCASLGTSSRN